MAREETGAHAEIETGHRGNLGAQDTCYFGTLTGVGRTCQQTFIGTYGKVAHVSLNDASTRSPRAGMLDDRAPPSFGEHEMPLLRSTTDRGSEFCGERETQWQVRYLDLEKIQHSRARCNSPRTDGIFERFPLAMEKEFCASAVRRKRCHSIEELQVDVDAWVESCDVERTRSGRRGLGQTPMQNFRDGRERAEGKQRDRTKPRTRNDQVAA